MPGETFKITRGDAERLIEGYINECIKKELVPTTIGGVIDMEAFLTENAREMEQLREMGKIPMAEAESEILIGLVCWSCWKAAADMKDAEFFLTLELNTGIVINKGMRQFPMHTSICGAKQHIDYADRKPSEILDDTKLELTLPDVMPRGNNLENPEEKSALTYINAFRESGPRDEMGYALNSYEFGVFETQRVEGEVLRFLSQPDMKYIRYFFGYDATKKGSKIRVILVGVRADGSNIFAQGGVSQASRGSEDDDGGTLQNSWPPRN